MSRLSPSRRHNALRRYRDPDDPEMQEAAREMRAASLEDHIRDVVDQAPPLTAEQRSRLATLLRPSDSGRDAS